MSDNQFPEESDPFGKYAHDEEAPTHSGKRGHFCWEWDGLWICEDCMEFEACMCELKEATEKQEQSQE